MTCEGRSGDDAIHAGPPSRIALVDDDAPMRRSVADLLESLGFAVQIYESAEAFLAAETAPAECLLLDIELPGMSGFELLERLSAANSSIPVVMLSGHASPDARHRARQLGALAFVAKPLNPDELVSAVQRSLLRTPRA